MPDFSGALRVYRKYLSRYFAFRLFREAALVVYRFTYRAARIARAPRARRRYALAPMATAQRQLQLAATQFEPSARLKLPAPRGIAFPPSAPKGAVNAADGVIEIATPKIEVVEVPSAVVIGGTNFILSGRTAIHPDCFIPETDTCPAEVVGVARLKRSRGVIDFFLRPTARKLPIAASMLGQNNRNYAHWLTETLPKLLILDALEGFDRVPLLVDEGLHPNIYESIAMINSRRRAVHPVKRWESVSCERLIDISQPAYEPYIPHRLRGNEIPKIINSFAPKPFLMLRDFAFSSMRLSEQKGTRVYLRRSQESSNLRQVTNAAEIEALIADYGFNQIDPGETSFLAQVKICMAANVILAPVGAALANMIFAQPGCKVIVLAPYFVNGSYFYYSNLAAVLGHKLVYVFGQPAEGKGGHPAHSNFSVEISDIRRALESAIDGRRP
jgi:capsular polysaccharide biosynthesis protein